MEYRRYSPVVRKSRNLESTAVNKSEFLHLMGCALPYFISGIRIAVMINNVIVTGPTMHATSHATPLRFARLSVQP